MFVPDKGETHESKVPIMKNHMDWAYESFEKLIDMSVSISVLVLIISKVLVTFTRESVRRQRELNMAWLRRQSEKLKVKSANMIAGVDQHVKQVLRAASPKGVHVALLLRTSEEFGIPEGESVVTDFLRGFRLVDEIPVVAHAKECEVRSPTVSKEELESRAKSNFLKATRIPKLSEEDVRGYRKVRDLTLEEVQHGRMTEPVPADESMSLRRTRPVTRRFPVVHLTSAGEEKVRPIDDFLTSEVNDLTAVRKKIEMGRVHDTVYCAKDLVRSGQTDLKYIKSDFKSAYRVCPIAKSDLQWSDVVFFCPDKIRWFLSKQLAMPFGAVGAVYAWDRVGFVLTFILSILLLVPFSRFVDDIFAIVPSEDAVTIRMYMLEVVSLLGFVLELEKTPVPSPLQVILGVEVLYTFVKRREKCPIVLKSVWTLERPSTGSALCKTFCPKV